MSQPARVLPPLVSPSGPVAAPTPPQGAPAPGKPWKLWVGLLAILLAAFGLWGWNASSNQGAAPTARVIRTATVVNGPIEQSVRLAGQTAAREFSTIVAPTQQGPDAGAMVLEFLVASGKRVRAGEVVARLDTQALADHLADVEDQVRDAAFSIEKRKAEHSVELENLQQSIRVYKSNLDKAKLEARAAEVRTTIDQERLRLAVEEAQATYDQNLANIAHKKVSQLADLRQLEIAKIRTDRHRARHANDLTKYTVTSPRDGLAVVQQVYRNNEQALIQAGDQLRPGQAFLRVVRPDRMEVLASMNQSESELFEIGQASRIKLDAVANVTFPGKLYKIGAVATSVSRRESNYIRTVPVSVTIDGSHDLLIPDMSAAVEVVLSGQKNANVVPLAAIQSESGQSFVWVKTASGYTKRQVEVGLKSSTHAAVVSGLQAGEEVALENPSA